MDRSTDCARRAAPAGALLALALTALSTSPPVTAESPAEKASPAGITVGFELLRNQIVLEVHLGDSGPYNFSGTMC